MLSAIPGGVAVLDHSGQVIQTNAEWENQVFFFESSAQVGGNFIEVCDIAADSGSAPAQLLAEGLREVLSGRRLSFSLEYEVPSAQEKWFSTCLRPFQTDGRTLFLVSHSELALRTRIVPAEISERLGRGALPCGCPTLDPNLEAIPKRKCLPNVALYQLELPPGETGVFTQNQGLWEMFGLSSRLGPIRADAFADFIHPEDRASFQLARENPTECLSFEQPLRILLPDGTIKWTQWHATASRLPNGTWVWNGLVIEVTDQKLSENELKRAYRTLKAIKACNDTLARATDEVELLAGVCSCLVKIGGAKLAWVGLVENDRRKTLRPVAIAGDDRGHLQNAKLTWGETSSGREPIGITIRSAEMTICRDVAHDPRLGASRKKLSQQGVASFVCLPLILGRACIGALTVCSPSRDAFQSEEVKLLSQLTDDIAFGIESLRARNEKELVAREMLRISEEEKKVVAQELHEGLCQHLAGTSVMGTVLQRRLATRDDPEAGAIRQICEQLNLGASQARTLSRGLQPVKEIPEGLMHALSDLANATSKLHQIRCDFECATPISLENPITSTHLFKIAQEAVQNSIKKGNATQIRIRLEKFSQQLELSVRDDAKGAPPAKGAKLEAIEIRAMRHRALVIGAKLRVYSTCRGTLVRCSLAPPGPIEDNE